MSNRFLKSSEVLEYVYEGQYKDDFFRNIDDSTEQFNQKCTFYTSVLKEMGLKNE
ncbi:MAG: hypothetical protein ACTSWX_07640 [Promethearchaeota archaeon]